ncbi:MAG: hypothetical protein J1F33_06015 [Clostridiales bacterium]|nr:hypothetical protein [Clostridiales bacterium]
MQRTNVKIIQNESYKKNTARLFVIVGNTPNKNDSNGKDLIIQAVDSMGTLHASIIPKYTSRAHKSDDGNEMICDCKFEQTDKGTRITAKDGTVCYGDIVYERNGNIYGFSSENIWDGLKRGKFQVVVVSDADTINDIRNKFGGLVVLVYVHSHNYENPGIVDEEFKLFSRNFDLFDHVLIYENKAEELYDQLFRLFRAYEKDNMRRN